MTRKRQSVIEAGQLGFTFDTPPRVAHGAALAGMDAFTSSLVAAALKDDERSRVMIAARMSELLDDQVTASMLDSWSSIAKDENNISFARCLALIAATDRHDLLNEAVRRIGATLLIGEEIKTARIGHLRAQKRLIEEELRSAERHVTPITRGPRT